MARKAKIKMYVEEAVAVKRCDKIVDQAWKDIVEYINDAYTYTSTSAKDMITKLGAKPTIAWKKFGFRAAGRTWYNNGVGLIEMNTNFLYSKDADEFIKNTTLHELAHLICLRLFKELKHNVRFRNIARVLGDDGERCHNYADPENKPERNKKKYYTVVCSCGEEHELSESDYEASIARKYLCGFCYSNLAEAKLRKINRI